MARMKYFRIRVHPNLRSPRDTRDTRDTRVPYCSRYCRTFPPEGSGPQTMNTRRPILVLLWMMSLTGCHRQSAPNNAEAAGAVREWLTERRVEIATNPNNYAGPAAAAAAEANARAQGAAVKVDITEIGSPGTADLQAPGSKDAFWPVHMQAVLPEETLSGTMLIFRDNFHRWKARQGEEEMRGVPAEIQAAVRSAPTVDKAAYAHKAGTKPKQANVPPTATTPGFYTVKKGDTLTSIAQTYGLTVEDLVKANTIADQKRLQLGQTLNMPPAPSIVSSNGDPETSLQHDLSFAKEIYHACQLYAMDNSGAFPKNLNELFPDYLSTRDILSSPLAPKPDGVDFEYLGAGFSDTEHNVEKVFLRGRYTAPDGRRSIVRIDGRASLERQ